MAGAKQTSDASPFNFSSSQSKPASLNKQTIIWLVVLSCVLIAAIVVVACLLCRCRRKRKDRRVSRGYSVKDGRNDFHPWNKNATPLPVAPAYGGYGVTYPTEDEVAPHKPGKIVTKSPTIEPMIVEQADNSSAGFNRTSKKASRYYGGGGWSARLSRFSQIGRAF